MSQLPPTTQTRRRSSINRKPRSAWPRSPPRYALCMIPRESPKSFHHCLNRLFSTAAVSGLSIMPLGRVRPQDFIYIPDNPLQRTTALNGFYSNIITPLTGEDFFLACAHVRIRQEPFLKIHSEG
ncbi:unnamed protein product, partial [Pleuronectes platessa]